MQCVIVAFPDHTHLPFFFEISPLGPNMYPIRDMFLSSYGDFVNNNKNKTCYLFGT